MSDFRHHIVRAVAIKGSQQKLAAVIGCTQQHISYLLTSAERISAEQAKAIHDATDGAVACWELRPDLWSAPAPQQQSEGAAA